MLPTVTEYVYVRDQYEGTRGFCRCPGCGYAWPHMETGNLKRDMEWASQHYGGPTQCDNCGEWSEPNDNRRQWKRGYYRQLCPASIQDWSRALEEEEER